MKQHTVLNLVFVVALSAPLLASPVPASAQLPKKSSTLLAELQSLSLAIQKSEDYPTFKAAVDGLRKRLKGKTLQGADTERKLAVCVENFITPIVADTENYAKHGERLKADDFFDLRIYSKSKKLLEQDSEEINEIARSTKSLIERSKAMESGFKKSCESAGVAKEVIDDELAAAAPAFRGFTANTESAERDLQISQALKSVIDILLSHWGHWKIEAAEDGDDEISFDDPKAETTYQEHMFQFEKLTGAAEATGKEKIATE